MKPTKSEPTVFPPRILEAQIGRNKNSLEWVRVTVANEGDCEEIQVVRVVLLAEHQAVLAEKDKQHQEALRQAKAECYEDAARHVTECGESATPVYPSYFLRFAQALREGRSSTEGGE